jgi:hypothetical protein
MSFCAETRAGALARRWRLSAETRAKMSAARAGVPTGRLIQPPAEEVALMVRLYPSMSLRALAKRVGYDVKVVRRALVGAGVALRHPSIHARRPAPDGAAAHG